MNLYDLLTGHFPEDRTTCAVESLGIPGAPLYYTWHDLERGTAMIANLLAGLDLSPGDRVVSHVEKSVEALMLYLACLRAGLVFVPLNIAYREVEMAYFLDDAKPTVLVCSPRNFGWLARLAFQRGVRSVYTLGDDRTGTLLDRAARCGDHFATVARNDDDLAAILYTSGTTGRSKGAMLTHRNLASNAQTLKTLWGWQGVIDRGGRDVLLNALPLFHIHGLFVACHAALIAGAKQIFFPKLDPRAMIEVLPRCTVMMGVPTFYVRMLAEPSLTREACRAMRLFISGSAPLAVDTFEQWRDRTGHTMLERYGMSETVMNTSNPYDDATRRKPGSVGQPLPGVDVRVMRADGSPCAVGDIGDVQVRGPNVFQGYWRMPEKTAQEFTADGWFKTGDVGRFDTDGDLAIVGRSKDLIITGGYNVYPKEIEGWLDAMPGVAESAVIGVPHPDFGEAVTAVVVPRADARLDAETIIATLKREIANFKVPKHVYVVDELPRNTMGKVQKNVLRERYSREIAA